MAYYPNPDLYAGFEEYLEEQGITAANTDEILLRRYREEYENFIENQVEWKPVTPFRYDYSEKELD